MWRARMSSGAQGLRNSKLSPEIAQGRSRMSQFYSGLKLYLQQTPKGSLVSGHMLSYLLEVPVPIVQKELRVPCTGRTRCRSATRTRWTRSAWLPWRRRAACSPCAWWRPRTCRAWTCSAKPTASASALPGPDPDAPLGCLSSFLLALRVTGCESVFACLALLPSFEHVISMRLAGFDACWDIACILIACAVAGRRRAAAWCQMQRGTRSWPGARTLGSLYRADLS